VPNFRDFWTRIKHHFRAPSGDIQISSDTTANWLDAAIKWSPMQTTGGSDYRAELDAWIERLPSIDSASEKLRAGRWLRKIAGDLFGLGDFDLGFHCLDRCQSLLKPLTVDSDLDAELETIACINIGGIAHYEQGRLDEAEAHYERAIAKRQEIAQRLHLPEDIERNQLYLNGAFCNLGHALRDQSRYEEAANAYRISISGLDQLLPTCTCGCQFLFADVIQQLTGFSLAQTTSNFLLNALEGRQELLHLMKSSSRFVALEPMNVDTVETESPKLRVRFLEGSLSAESHHETVLHDALNAAVAPEKEVVFDVREAGMIDERGIALLHHLRARAIGYDRWPTLLVTPEQSVDPVIADCVNAFSTPN
jgi:tetratricopeptide (TPR) repeat protein